MSKTIQLQHVGFTGEGRTRTEAKEHAEAQATRALAGDYSPEVFNYRAFTFLLFRTPRDGWSYSIITDETGPRNDKYANNPPGFHTFKAYGQSSGESRAAVLRQLLRHLADLAWTPSDGDTVPAFVTNTQDRSDLAINHRWQLLIIEGRERHGLDDERARCYADRTQRQFCTHGPSCIYPEIRQAA